MSRSALVLVSALLLIHQVVGHGHMEEPPMRSSMWRFGFNTPPNYNDDGLNCGGFGAQWEQNDGKCGECGDDYALPRPRPNEAGGQYGNGIIVREYTVGQVIPVTLNFSTTHAGYFEFRLCPTNDPAKLSTQECFDQNLLELADGSGTRWTLPDNNSRGVYNLDLQLPQGLTCSFCVLQWYYVAGNRWGDCGDGGIGALGCGPQESYRNCADISIA